MSSSENSSANGRAAEDDAKLEIQLNGEAYAVPAKSTILTLLEQLERHPRTVAVERNGDIVRRPSYGQTPLEAGDRLEIVHFVQGG